MESIEYLINQLDLILQNRQTHFHCITPAWGGTELSAVVFGADNVKVNKISVGKILE